MTPILLPYQPHSSRRHSCGTLYLSAYPQFMNKESSSLARFLQRRCAHFWWRKWVILIILICLQLTPPPPCTTQPSVCQPLPGVRWASTLLWTAFALPSSFLKQPFYLIVLAGIFPSLSIFLLFHPHPPGPQRTPTPLGLPRTGSWPPYLGSFHNEHFFSPDFLIDKVPQALSHLILLKLYSLVLPSKLIGCYFFSIWKLSCIL